MSARLTEPTHPGSEPRPPECNHRFWARRGPVPFLHISSERFSESTEFLKLLIRHHQSIKQPKPPTINYSYLTNPKEAFEIHLFEFSTPQAIFTQLISPKHSL
jgi:hypothetical protein